MAEPTVLYNPDGEALVLYAPSEVRRLEADGWTRTPPAKPKDEPKQPAPKINPKGKR